MKSTRTPEQDEVLNFMNDLKPIAEAAHRLSADFRDVLAKSDIPTESEARSTYHYILPESATSDLTMLMKSARTANSIYLEIRYLNAPPCCEVVKSKWQEAYEYYQQGLCNFIICLNLTDVRDNDCDVACDSYHSLMAEGDRLAAEAEYEMQNLADAYGVNESK